MLTTESENSNRGKRRILASTAIRKMLLVCLGGAIATCAFMAKGLQGHRDPPPREPSGRSVSDELLTVEETLGFLFMPFIDENTAPFYTRANPAAKDALHKILDNQKHQPYHEIGWSILGYIGNTGDLTRIRQALERLKGTRGPLSNAERNSLTGIFNCVGVMCRRDVEGASALAGEMLDPAYWRDAKFQWYAKPSPDGLSVEYESVYRFISWGYSLSLKPDIMQRARAIVESTDNAAYRMKLERMLPPERLLGYGRNRLLDEDKPALALRESFARLFNGDLENPGPAEWFLAREAESQKLFEQKTDQTRRQHESARTAIADPHARRLTELAKDVGFGAEGQITRLSFIGETITDETMQLLDGVPDLTYLSLVQTAVTDDGLAHLKTLKCIERLTVSSSDKISNEGLQHLATLTTLTALDLVRLPKVTGEGLKHLKPLEKLQGITLQNLNITVEDLRTFEHLKHLERLQVYFAPD